MRTNFAFAMAVAVILAGCATQEPAPADPPSVPLPGVELQSLVREFDLVVTGAAGPNPVGNQSPEPVEALMNNCVVLENATAAGVANVTARLTGTPNVPGTQVKLGVSLWGASASNDVVQTVTGTPPLMLEFDYHNATLGKTEPSVLAFWAFPPREPVGAAVSDTYQLVLDIKVEDASALSFNARAVCHSNQT